MDKIMILFACFIGTLSICWKNMIPLTPVELGNLDWCNATRRHLSVCHIRVHLQKQIDQSGNAQSCQSTVCVCVCEFIR